MNDLRRRAERALYVGRLNAPQEAQKRGGFFMVNVEGDVKGHGVRLLRKDSSFHPFGFAFFFGGFSFFS